MIIRFINSYPVKYKLPFVVRVFACFLKCVCCETMHQISTFRCVTWWVVYIVCMLCVRAECFLWILISRKLIFLILSFHCKLQCGVNLIKVGQGLVYICGICITTHYTLVYVSVLYNYVIALQNIILLHVWGFLGSVTLAMSQQCNSTTLALP
jgi:hypothetical protein